MKKVSFCWYRRHLQPGDFNEHVNDVQVIGGVGAVAVPVEHGGWPTALWSALLQGDCQPLGSATDHLFSGQQSVPGKHCSRGRQQLVSGIVCCGHRRFAPIKALWTTGNSFENSHRHNSVIAWLVVVCDYWLDYLTNSITHDKKRSILFVVDQIVSLLYWFIKKKQKWRKPSNYSEKH